MLARDEQPTFADRFVRPLARVLLNSPPGKVLASSLVLPWLFKRPLADYDFVARLFRDREVGRLDGDMLELGSWLGFGTIELAKLASPWGKAVHTVDQFPTDFRKPESVTADSSRRYIKLYPGMTQRQAFDQNTRAYPNIVVHERDIMDLAFPPTQRFVCTVIDAAKSAHENRYYLDLAWPHTTPGGLVFVDDYRNPDYPGVAEGVDGWIAAHQSEVASVHVKKERRIVGIVRALRS